MFIELVSQTQMPQPLRTIVRTEKLDSYYVVIGRHSFYSSSNTVEMRTQDGYVSSYIRGSIQTSSERKVLVRASETSPVTPSLLSKWYPIRQQTQSTIRFLGRLLSVGKSRQHPTVVAAS